MTGCKKKKKIKLQEESQIARRGRPHCKKRVRLARMSTGQTKKIRLQEKGQIGRTRGLKTARRRRLFIAMLSTHMGFSEAKEATML
jgi:hypothetical protein